MESSTILMILKEAMGCETDLTMDMEFQKEELDSIVKVQLLIMLEEYLERELSIVDLFKCETIGDIVNMCYIEGENG